MAYTICKYGRGGGPIPDVPDGKTVTPINDVTIWQECAGLDPVYTTLNEVLNDSGYTAALMSDDNAVDYMVRSTDWATEQPLVPVMTSNTTPSGECIGSGVYQAAYDYYKSFDRDISTYGIGGTTTTSSGGDYLGYIFTEPTYISKIYIHFGYANTVFNIQGSEDGTTGWADIGDSITGQEGLKITQTVAGIYKGLRIYKRSSSANIRFGAYEIQFYSAAIPSSETAMQYIGASDYASNTLLADSTWREAICNSSYFETILNTKVPIMTSNTTPLGVASSSSMYNDNIIYQAWKAFDGDDSSSNLFCTKLLGKQWIEYCFDKAVTAYKTLWIGQDSFNERNPSGYLQASNDGITYTNIKEINWRNDHIITDSFVSSAPYTRYRIYNTSNTAEYLACYTFQIYGRENGGVQTWLKAANIKKNYYSLSQVLNDTATLSALMANEDAVDYLVTVKSWVSAIVSNEAAMGLIGNNNYASNTLLADNDWHEAIVNSAYMELVLNIKVPIMTSNTVPSGEASCYKLNASGGDAYRLFDGNTATFVDQFYGQTGTLSNQWIQYEFPQSVKIKAFSIRFSGGPITSFKIQATNDTTLIDIQPFNGSYSSNTTYLFSLNNEIKYKKWRYQSLAGSGSVPYFCEIQFYGREDI